MGRVRVSSRYQIVLPKDVRTRVLPGQEFEVITKGGIISLVPVYSISSMRGFAKGVRTSGFREKKDRF